MDFERRLKEELKNKTLEMSREKLKRILESLRINNTYMGGTNQWRDVVTGIKDLIYEYMEKYSKLTTEQIVDMMEMFSEMISNSSLNEMKKDIKLTEQEERNIKYEELKYYSDDRITPISKVLLRRKLLEFIEKFMKMDKVIEMLENGENSGVIIRQSQYIKEFLSDEFWVTEEQWQERLKEDTERWFDDRINCGGYALELDTCVFNHSNDFEKAVSGLLNKISFVRLLGDTKLEDDEYLVIWKVHEGGGHHFIKVQEDGTIIEKDGNEPIRKFSGWSKTLNGCPEAVLAVKKEHDMHRDEEGFSLISIDDKDGLDFEQTAQSAIQVEKNSFEYHNHTYYFKKDESGNVYICSEGRIVADAFIEDGQCLVDIVESEKRYVSNTQPPQPLIIKDGKIQNWKKDEMQI